jgi:hypothetical protein
LFTIVAAPARAQETEPPDGTKINSTQVSGTDVNRFSPGLRDDIGKLAGTPLNRQTLKDLAARMEAEQPRYVAAVRVLADPDGGAKVIFVVARIREQGNDVNINHRYVVEDVDVRGVPEREIDPALLADLRALAGKPLDSDEVERLETRLRDALPDYQISRQTTRASQQGRIKLIFALIKKESARWLRYEPLEGNAIYHSDQGWGANLPLAISGGDFLFAPVVAIDDGDELIEEYSGFGMRFESRKIGTERLGALFEWSTYDQTWRDATLAAVSFDPRVPPLYRNRMAFTPLVKFAITKQLTIGGGVSIAELDAFPSGPVSQMANAGVGLLRFSKRSWMKSRARHDVEASFTVRAGTRSLQSDLVYERYLGEADYSFKQSSHRVLVSAKAGRINGEAPLFERFSLGNSRTLRGWDKYDITPAGGDRMFYASVEYQYHGLAMFLDSGSVWNTGTERRVRVSTGFGFTPGPVFFTVGFPINTDEFRAVFTMGFRFPESRVDVHKY